MPMTEPDHRAFDHSDQNREQRLRTLFAQAIDLPTAERKAFVDAQCADDAELARDVLDLLACHSEDIKDHEECVLHVS